MAMFLSRLKQVLNLGTKSITSNGTYYASSDGYDGYSSVSVTVPTPPSITPSNSSPAALTSGSAVTPSANGYAIESYSSVTPSNSSPVTLTSGDIVKLGGNGKAVASVTNVTPSSTPTSVSANDVVKIGGSGVIVDSVPTPTSITPSNSSPATITSGTTYTATANGKAVESVVDVNIDSDWSLYGQRMELTKDQNYHINNNSVKSGYIIADVRSVTPTDSGVTLNQQGNPYVLTTSRGYLYASSGLKKVKTGTFQTSTSSYVTVTCGFEPKYIAIEGDGTSSSGKHFMSIYNSDTSTSQSYYANASNYPTTVSMGTSSNMQISITNTGFTFRMTTSPVRTCRYFAIG